MKNEKDLFELIENIGETLNGDLHIIDNSEEYPAYEGEKEFRVYHKNGICFDIKKEVEQANEETDVVEKWEYYMYNEWDGFKKDYTANEAYILIKKETKQ